MAALLAGEPAEVPEGCDALDLASFDAPDLRFAKPARLAPLFARPAVRRVAHLSMAEGACKSLEAVLGWLEPGCLRSLTLTTTEAEGTATDEHTLPLIAASPATRSLRSLCLRRTSVHDLQALTTSALRSLESLELVGWVTSSSTSALSRPAPALRRLKRLVLTPDALYSGIARNMAASPDLAALEHVELPFLPSGYYWGGVYDEYEFEQNFPDALEALKALPALKTLTLSNPFGASLDNPVLPFDMQRRIIERLGGALPVTAAPGLLYDEFYELIGRDDPYFMEWGLHFFGEHHEAPPLGWVESLFRSGAAAAMGFSQAPPSQRDDKLAEVVAELERVGCMPTQEADVSWVERWGEATLLAVLAERYTPVKLLRTRDALLDAEAVVIYDPERLTEAEALTISDIEHLVFRMLPRHRPDQARAEAAVARIGAARIGELAEQLFYDPLAVRKVDGVWLAFFPDDFTDEQLQAAARGP